MHPVKILTERILYHEHEHELSRKLTALSISQDDHTSKMTLLVQERHRYRKMIIICCYSTTLAYLIISKLLVLSFYYS